MVGCEARPPARGGGRGQRELARGRRRPPPHHSPRLWRRVLDWLLRLAAQTARLLINLVDKAGKVLSSISVSAVGIELSAEGPGVSFEFPIREMTDDTTWDHARMFLNGALAELEEKVFS